MQETEQRTTNEQLAIKIQNGERDAIEPLWWQVEKFARSMAAKWIHAWRPSRPTLDCDDLMQAAFLAMVDAVETFDSSRETKFVTWYGYYLKTHFTEVVGCRTKSQQGDPIHGAISLDAPLTLDEDAASLGDITPDPTDCYQSTEQAIYSEQLHRLVDAAIDDLPERDGQAIRLRYWQGHSLTECAEIMKLSIGGVKQHENKGLLRLAHCSHTKKLREALYQDSNLMGGTGFRAWKNTGLSVQERIMIRLEDLEERERRR